MRANAVIKLIGHMYRQNLTLLRRAKCAPLPIPVQPKIGIMNAIAGG